MNVLEDYLSHFEGTLIVVSHDRYFMDKLTDHLFVFKGDGHIVDFPGNYSDYKNQLDQEVRVSVKTPPKTRDKQAQIQEKKRKLSFHEQKEYETLEKEIQMLEEEKRTLVDKLNSGSDDHESLMQWAREIEQLTERLDEKELRWLELSEMVK
jgi:ATP-binding cassette subfamily F protein uup